LDLRAGTVSSEINALSLEMKEVFDVIDTEIRSLDEELRGVTPEVVTRPILEAIANVNRRYERMLARLDRQAAAVTEEIPATERIYAETLDVIDVTIIYVEEELALALEEE
jgi:biotin synthase-related radical SAM superfamily protein